MPRKTATQRAEAAIAAVLTQLARARAEVARLEAVVGKLTGNLVQAQPAQVPEPTPAQAAVKSGKPPSIEALMAEAQRNPMPVTQRKRPPPPADDGGHPVPAGAEISPADTLGKGRWM